MNFKVRNLDVANYEQAKEEISRVGSDAAGCRRMAYKAVHRVLKVSDLKPKQANIIKQEMLSRGGEAAVARGTIDNSIETTDLILMGTLEQYRELIKKLKMQPFSLSRLAVDIEKALDNLEGNRVINLDCRGKNLELGRRTLVMGILNVTPDSFSDGGRYYRVEEAVKRAVEMEAEGADIIDIGGESTRPGHVPVGMEDELARVMPVLERVVQEVNVPVSIDTYKAEVARKALEAGASIINDQWAFRADSGMAEVAASFDVPAVIMHNKNDTEYKDLMGDIIEYFRESIDTGISAGLVPEKIIIDPGIGFGKTLEQNLEVMHRLRELRCLGHPLLLGTSRKSMIGKTLDVSAGERVEGTASTVALGITYGADIVRVHDVKEMKRVATMTDAMIRCGESDG